MNNGSAEVSMLTNDVMALPRITSGFHLRLKKNVIVDSKTFIELHSFHQVSEHQSFSEFQQTCISSDQFLLFIRSL